MEPFPALNTGLQAIDTDTLLPTLPTKRVKPRRKSSSLTGEQRGDTGAAALATWNENTPPSTPGIPQRSVSERANPRSKRRKAKRVLRRTKSLLLRHTWLGPLIVSLAFILAYLPNPTPSNPVHRFLFLSYPVPRVEGADPSTPIQYGKGGNDFLFVFYYAIVLSFTREFIMQRFLKPLAIRCGFTKRAKQNRFMEQAYTALYFLVLGPYGLYVMSRSPVWYFNTTGMYEGFPHRTHEGLFKAYYLLQAAYWSQQLLVLILILEAPRKDFKELVLHHIITIALIWCSYRFHFTYMGIAVYITHDISDFFLATSKILNYLDSPFGGPYFGTFIFIWAYTRHYINLRIIWSVLTEFATIGPFELNWETQQYKCWISQVITFGLLASLQAVNLFWFFLILRIAYRYVFQNIAKDERSDDEEEAEDEEPVSKSANGKVQVLLNGEPVEENIPLAKQQLKANGQARESKKGR